MNNETDKTIIKYFVKIGNIDGELKRYKTKQNKTYVPFRTITSSNERYYDLVQVNGTNGRRRGCRCSLSFKLRRIIFGISYLKMLIISSPAKETKSVESRYQSIFLEKHFDVVHFKV